MLDLHRNHALEAAENALLARAGTARQTETVDFGRQIGNALGCTILPDDFAPYVGVRTVEAGKTLLRQGEEAETLFFIESGGVSIELEVPNRPNLRLCTTTAGTVIGEVAMLQGGRRTATAIAQTICRVSKLDRTALARMERERPALALLVQRFLVVELADTTRLLEAETR